jgi:hypothetical protein
VRPRSHPSFFVLHAAIQTFPAPRANRRNNAAGAWALARLGFDVQANSPDPPADLVRRRAQIIAKLPLATMVRGRYDPRQSRCAKRARWK